MEKEKKHIVIIAGEASGDIHAAHLVEALKKLSPSTSFSGLGGNHMKEAGVEVYYDLTKIAVIGFSDVIKHYGEFKRIFDLILDKITSLKPDCVILVDYPGFNLRLAKKLKERKIKVAYYISPQVWAWKKNRVYQVKKYVDRMLVIFKFEKEFYAKYGIDVSFVGHPLIDDIKITVPKDSFLKKINLAEYRMTIGLLPGSRECEIQRILPPMLKAASILGKKFPMLQFLLIKAPTIERGTINRYIEESNIKPFVIEDDRYNAINACDLCMVASGTATLETAIIQKPMIIVYKTSLLTYLLAKLFVKIPYIGLANVVAGKRIVPEAIQHEATGKQIAEKIESIFTNEIKIAQIKSDLAQLKRSLDAGGAHEKAAGEIMKLLAGI